MEGHRSRWGAAICAPRPALRPRPGLVFTEPKTDPSSRTIAVPAPLFETLRRHRVAQAAERLVAVPTGRIGTSSSPSPTAARSTSTPDYEAWVKLLQHDGRHTAATLLLTAGVHPRVVMELLGHSQMRTTTDIYSHVMPALAQEAADRMAKTLWT